MAELIHVETDFGELAGVLREVAVDITKELRVGLLAVAKEIATEVRTKVPSGMAKGKNKGVTWKYYGSKGAVVQAGGNKKPASWIGAYDGAGKASTFRHPVYGGKNRPRKEWGWADQATNPILESTWAERRTWAVLKSDEAIDKAMRKAGFRTE